MFEVNCLFQKTNLNLAWKLDFLINSEKNIWKICVTQIPWQDNNFYLCALFQWNTPCADHALFLRTILVRYTVAPYCLYFLRHSPGCTDITHLVLLEAAIHNFLSVIIHTWAGLMYMSKHRIEQNKYLFW